MGSILVKIDEDTYKINNLYIKKNVIDGIHKVINNSVDEHKLNKIYNIIVKD